MATINPAKIRNCQGEREQDEKGRATSGHQSSFNLSLSLVGTGKVFGVGLSTKEIRPDLFALFWKPVGSGWTFGSWIAARTTFFDLIELEASHFLGETAKAR